MVCKCGRFAIDPVCMPCCHVFVVYFLLACHSHDRQTQDHLKTYTHKTDKRNKMTKMTKTTCKPIKTQLVILSELDLMLSF